LILSAHESQTPEIMASELVFLCIITIGFLTFSSIFLHRLQTVRLRKAEAELEMNFGLVEPTTVAKRLVSALPNSVILPQNVEAFKQALNAYWAQQECEVIPACIVRPYTVQELGKVVSILKREYAERENDQEIGRKTAVGVFAVRGGGHSPVPGAASVEGGVVVDLRHLNSVTLSEDGENVIIGGGAKWLDVSKILDERGLAIVGGRNAAVGVGGLTLGGKTSFFIFYPPLTLLTLPLLCICFSI
jgi:hypothetical protein